MMLNIEEIKEREQVATKGPWVVRENKSFGIQSENKNIASCFRRENENFIAHARQDIPDLIAEVERLQDLLAERNVLLDKQDVELAESRRRERAAVKDIMCCDHCDVCLFGKEHDGECKKADYDCLTCKSATCACRECRNGDHWQWRGPQNEKGAEQSGKV